MTDRDLHRVIRSWLHEERHEDAEPVLDTVLAQLDTIPQRRSAGPAWRTPIMNNTARLITAAAAAVVVALIGYQLLIAPNIGGPVVLPSPSAPTAAPSPSVSGDAAVSVPGEFTACLPSNTESRAGTDETVVVPHPEGDMTVEQRRGFTWAGDITATDERFSGRHYYSWDGDQYTLASGDPGPQIVGEGMRIENDQGAWQGGSTYVGLPDETTAGGLVVLTGEGAYAGLEAVMFGTDGGCFQNWRGVVIEIPAIPVPYTGA